MHRKPLLRHCVRSVFSICLFDGSYRSTYESRVQNKKRKTHRIQYTHTDTPHTDTPHTTSGGPPKKSCLTDNRPLHRKKGPKGTDNLRSHDLRDRSRGRHIAKSSISRLATGGPFSRQRGHLKRRRSEFPRISSSLPFATCYRCRGGGYSGAVTPPCHTDKRH